MIRRVKAGPSTGYEILTGDVREMLATLPDESVQCCVTSPPYWGLRDYKTEPQVWGGDAGCEHEWGTWKESHDEREKTTHGKTRTTDRCYSDESRRFNGNHQKHTAGAFCHNCSAWRGHLGLEPTPELYVEHLVEIFREVRRVLRKDGTFWLNIGDCYATSPPGNQPNTTKDVSGLPNSRENLEMRRAAQVRRKDYGHLKPKNLVGIPWRVAFALQADGWYLRSDVIWSKPNPMPESCRDRPTKAHEYVFLMTKSARYYFDQEAVREPIKSTSGEVSVAPHGKHVLETGHREQHVKKYDRICGANIRTVWTIPTQPFSEPHFATFPEALPERCIRAGTSEWGCCPECGSAWVRVFSRVLKTFLGWRPTCECGGQAKSAEVSHPPVPCTVLDPFVGSGTTAIVAVRLGRKAIGIDLSKKYTDLTEKQLAVVEPGSTRRPKKFRLKGRKRIAKRRG